MYYIDNIGFELKYTIKEKISSFPEEDKYNKFILTYTTIDNETIEKMDFLLKTEIIKFIYNKLNLENSRVFLESCINISNKVNTDIRYLIFQLLASKDYKIGELYEWDFNKLMTVFYFEVLKDEKIKQVLYNFLPKYYTNEEDKEILSYFPKIFGELNIQENISNEQEELIKKLSNL